MSDNPTHALAAGLVCLLMFNLLLRHAIHIFKAGYSEYYANTYSQMEPTHTPNDFFIFFLSLCAFTLIFGAAGIGFLGYYFSIIK